ncbi:hypothetical protein [Catenulispora subtropica]|uniref:NADP-dependent oxidoreductase n=1 Tax=Catenulispora subtropica TaxID=450798 RepID=A0ABN2S8C5_9ACTN
MADFLTIQLSGRTFDELRAEQFSVAPLEIAPLKPGQALVANIYLCVGAEAERTVRHGWHLHTPMPSGPAIGEIVESRAAALPVGSVVVHDGGWSTHTVVTAGRPDVTVVDRTDRLPLTFQFSVLGTPGLSAWAGVREVLRLQAEERLLVAAAPSPTGYLVTRTAELHGVHDVRAGLTSPVARDGSGSARVLDALGALAAETGFEPFDAAWTDLPVEQLSEVGALVRDGGRIAAVHPSVVAQPPGLLRSHSGTTTVEVRGYLAAHYAYLRSTALAYLRNHVVARRITPRETTVRGFENVVEVFLGVLSGVYQDPVIVQITDPPTAPAPCSFTAHKPQGTTDENHDA